MTQGLTQWRCDCYRSSAWESPEHELPIRRPWNCNEQHKRYALVTMCIGVGQGYATIIENLNL